MANLETMRSFQKHWKSYCADERELARLCTRLPLRSDCLTAQDRRGPLFVQPHALAYDHDALENALGADGVHWGYRVDEDTQWGWWLADDAWQVAFQLRGALELRAAVCAELAAIASAAQEAKDGDAALVEARSTLRSYTAADREEHTELEDLQAQRTDLVAPYERAQHERVPWFLKPIKRIRLWWRRHFTLRDECAKLDQRISDTHAKLEVRARKIDELRETISTRTAALEEPFAQPCERVCAAAEEIERSAVDLLERDLVARCDGYEAGSLAELPFDEALDRANEREWALLDRWMAAYVERLPEQIVHARNVVESELAWLEVHAPFGKRYWPLTDQVVTLMEEGRADTSDLALKLVRR